MFFWFLLFVISISSLSLAQTTNPVTALDSVYATLDQSAPSANLVANDKQVLSDISCYAVRVDNQSSHDILVAGMVFGIYSPYEDAQLEMHNIQALYNDVRLGVVNSWSLNVASRNIGFYFPNPLVIAKHTSVVINLRADLYGWGTFNVSLTDLAVTDIAAKESKVLHYEPDWNNGLFGNNLVLANTDHLRLKLQIYPRGGNGLTADTLYVLPGEYFFSSGYCDLNPANYLPNCIVGFRTSTNIGQDLTGGDFSLSAPWTDDLKSRGHVTMAVTNTSQIIDWTVNSTSGGIEYFNFSWLSGHNSLPVGASSYIYFSNEAVLYSPFMSVPLSQYADYSRAIKSVDGVLGDFNGDGAVLMDDVDELQKLYTSLGYIGEEYQYTRVGYNLGKTAILFDGSTLCDLFLLRVWLNHPDDPLVSGLGIGQLMSQRTRPVPVGYTTTQTGDMINISTKAYAVRISAMLPSGKLWSKAATVSNGKILFTVPDGRLKYKVEAVSLPGQVTGVEGKTELSKTFSLAQNYPNPFNPTTSISYSIPQSGSVTLKVYDILGRDVMTLVNEQKAAGVYTVDFNGAQLASGTYIYRLNAGEFVQTKKMILIK